MGPYKIKTVEIMINVEILIEIITGAVLFKGDKTMLYVVATGV
jgi:hypothetical protein